jgi:hypothetical protein
LLYRNEAFYIYRKKEMVYLHNTTDPQVFFVPRSGAVPQGDMRLKAKSTIDLDTEINEGVTDLQTSDLYFNLAISLHEGIPDGEYEYTLYAGDIVLSTGLMMVGGFSHPEQYEKEITYEQYETE